MPSVTPHVPIPTRDGTLLSAAIHWPPGAPANGPYPALIEYHPYRKDDRSSPRAADHDYFAQNGFVSVRLDVRGTGSSQGVNTDEYMAVETQDGYDAVQWLASQEWSNGAVGMFGSSYGGFTSYQVATLQPPALKAIVPIYATDDRYTDDCHYKGGALKGYYDVGTYGTMMVAMNGLPPDPELFGAPADQGADRGWEQEWERRLEANEPYMEKWLEHRRDGDYWRPGSLRGQYEQLKAATFIIGGWQDGYPNPPLRAFRNIDCPKKVLIGPWNHSRPDVAIPGPRIDYLNEMRRWFDLHLKGIDDGISGEPPVTVYVQHYDPPDPARTETAGAWRSANSWPESSATEKVLYLGGPEPAGGQRLSDRPVVAERSSSLEVDPTAGTRGGLWSGGLEFGLPDDQRSDEARSLVYTTLPLREPVTIAGHPVLEVTAASSAETALFVAKLSDVAPDGRSALICRGVLNGTRRHGLESPEAMKPHETYRLQIELDATAWRVERGHRLRLAVSGSDFPNSWPAPDRGTIRIDTGGAVQSTLTLPVLQGEGVPSPEFGASQKPVAKFGTGDVPEWTYQEEPLTGDLTLGIHRASTMSVREGVGFFGSGTLSFTVNRNSPANAKAVGEAVSEISYRDKRIRSTARQQVSSDANSFHWAVDLRVEQDGAEKYRRKWEKSFPRDLM